ncbi:hypothetical protein QBC45DRAFT_392084 [Copromyces sp. CBS 386.78]|nr:hypothetical protein QBC45DRAFT_392084 [Copromyces sp. CBS 386.78]
MASQSQNKQSPQSTPQAQGNPANQQFAPQPSLQVAEWLDPMLVVDDDMEFFELPPNDGFGLLPANQQFLQQSVENPVDQQFAQNAIHQQAVQGPMAQGVMQNPINQQLPFVQNPMNQQLASPNPVAQQFVQNPVDQQQPFQNPMGQQFLQYPMTNIVLMDRVMADAVGTDLQEVYWSILDDIFYFLRDQRWDSLPNIEGNPRSRTSIQASYRAVGPPPAYTPPAWPLYEASTLAEGKANIRQLIQDNMRFAIDAFNWAAYMDRFGNLEVTYANLGQTRPIVAGLHAKLAVHEQQGVSWDPEKHGAVSQVLQETVFKNEPEFLAGEEWERRQLSHRVTTRNGRSQAALADVPRLPEREREKVRELMVDALNEQEIVDKPTHRTNRGEKDNHVLVAKRHMSLLNMESTAWKAMRALRKVSLGTPDVGVFNLDFMFKPYDSFGDRLRDFRNLFRSSKAAVTNVTETPITIRYAGRPGGELTRNLRHGYGVENGRRRSHQKRNLIPSTMKMARVRAALTAAASAEETGAGNASAGDANAGNPNE